STIRQGISTYQQITTKEILHIPCNILYERGPTGSKAKILTNPLVNPIEKRPANLLLNFLTNPRSTN
ncbi:hypothetical protein, partial [Bacillus paranthracis]|uniref:hypothetical protein n=1 Tax=Bacillus paranthracis TaxID=2026186 RepID=UPI002852EDE8